MCASPRFGSVIVHTPSLGSIVWNPVGNRSKISLFCYSCQLCTAHVGEGAAMRGATGPWRPAPFGWKAGSRPRHGRRVVE
jgi:hypothetical protein